MTRIGFIDDTGEETAVDAQVGLSVMETARASGIEGIVAECGGNLMCATCHVYVAEEWVQRLPAPDVDEEIMLDETAAPRQPTSRLSCQLTVGPELDGLVIRVPPYQV